MSVADYVYFVNRPCLFALLGGAVGGYSIVYHKFFFKLVCMLLLTAAGYSASRLSIANGDPGKEFFPLIIVFMLSSIVTILVLDRINDKARKPSGRES